jgi:galactose oxidase
VTHTLNTDNRVVFLNFRKVSIFGFHVLLIDAPFRGAQAIPGDYMLFVVNEHGTPAVAKHVRLASNN